MRRPLADHDRRAKHPGPPPRNTSQANPKDLVDCTNKVVCRSWSLASHEEDALFRDLFVEDRSTRPIQLAAELYMLYYENMHLTEFCETLPCAFHQETCLKAFHSTIGPERNEELSTWQNCIWAHKMGIFFILQDFCWRHILLYPPTRPTSLLMSLRP